MLTPVSQISAQSAAGGNPRSAATAGVTERLTNPVAATKAEKEAQIQPNENVSIERLRTLLLAAGISQQGLLQKLADMIARTLRVDRLPGEPAEKHLDRLAGLLENLPADKQVLVEIRTGLKPVGITLGEVAKAFRDPAGPQAARLAALIETPDFNTADASAKVALSSYLDDGAGENRSAETLHAQTAARGSSKGQNIFSPHVGVADVDAKDARNLQTVLAQAFTDNDGRQPKADGALAKAGTETAVTVKNDTQLRSSAAVAHEKLAELKVADAGTMASAKNNIEIPAARLQTTPRQQTMMIMRGLTEVIGNLADRAAETLRNVVESQSIPAQEKAVRHPAAVAQPPRPIPELAAVPGGKLHEASGLPVKDVPVAQGLVPVADEMAEADARAKPLMAAALLARQGESAEATAQQGRLAQRFAEPLPVPFASVPYPVEDVEEKYPARRKGHGSDSGEDTDDWQNGDADGDHGENAADHREDSDREEPELDTEEEALLELNRSSTDADRAFRHYQRMSGF